MGKNAVKTFIYDDSGASSVLVIFMMLVLVTLGAFAIVSANANYRLSRRAVDWNTMYYELDARGEEFLAQVDMVLRAGENVALDYTIDYFSKIDTPTELMPKEIFNRTFLEISNLSLTHLTLDQPYSNVYNIYDGLEAIGIIIEMMIMSPDPSYDECGILIEIEILPANHVEVNAEKTEVYWEGQNRYVIKSWYEFQDLAIEGEGIEFWDGTLFF